MPKVKNYYNVYVKTKMFMPKFMPHKSKNNAKVHGSCHVHATTQRLMKMVKSMNFAHDTRSPK